MSRATRRSRLGSKRAQRREAEKDVARIIEFHAQGRSTKTIASCVSLSEPHVEKLLVTLGLNGQDLEESVGEGVGGP
jgi:hypothetical protein